MKHIYIKFLRENDIHVINPLFDLVPSGEPLPQKICSKCGTTLYIPFEIAEDGYSVNVPMGELYQFCPIERPDLISKSEPDLPVLSYKNPLSFLEQQRLKQFSSVCYVGNDGFEMLIADIRLEPVEHNCNAN